MSCTLALEIPHTPSYPFPTPSLGFFLRSPSFTDHILQSLCFPLCTVHSQWAKSLPSLDLRLPVYKKEGLVPLCRGGVSRRFHRSLSTSWRSQTGSRGWPRFQTTEGSLCLPQERLRRKVSLVPEGRAILHNSIPVPSYILPVSAPFPPNPTSSHPAPPSPAPRRVTASPASERGPLAS